MSKTYFIDLLNGNDAGNGVTFSGRWKSLAKVIPLAVSGDTVDVMESPLPIAAGVTGHWISKSPIVTLSAALNAEVGFGATGWVAPNTLTRTKVDPARYKIPTGTSPASVNLHVTAAWIPPGTIAYKNLPSSISLSGFHIISFWIYNTQPVLANQLAFRMCSGLNGSSTIYTGYVPPIASIHQWVPIVLDFGVNLLGSISSLAFDLNVASPIYPIEFNVDNIVACRAPGPGSITHNTLIGKPNSTNAGGNDSETWFTVGGIDVANKVLYIDNDPLSVPSGYKGYYGTTETVQLYTREPIITPLSPAVDGVLNDLVNAGSFTSPITWKFGMSSSAMVVQSGETWMTGRNGYGVAIKLEADFNQISGIGLVRYASGLYLSKSHGSTADLSAIGHCAGQGILLDGPSTANTVKVGFLHNCGDTGYMDDPHGGRNDLNLVRVFSNNGFGSRISSNDMLHDGFFQNNVMGGIMTSGAVRIYRVQTDDNALAVGGTAAQGRFGLLGTYYNGTNFDSGPVSRVDANLNFEWGEGESPISGINEAAFSVRWLGYLQSPTTESYTISTISDDGVRVWFDGTLVINDWTLHGATQDSFTVNLTAGQRHTLKIEYFQGIQIGVMQLLWRSATIPLQIVPAGALSYDSQPPSAIWVDSASSAGYEVNIHDSLLNETNQFGGITDLSDVRVRVHNYQKAKGSHLTVTDGAKVMNESGANRHTLSGFAWKLMPAPPRSMNYPLDYKLASLAVLGGKQVTVTAFFKRTDVNITGQLVVPGGQLDGVPVDVISSVTLVGSYQQLTVKFTPTEIGVIDVYARAFGGTSSAVWVDDMGVAQ